jgi:GT2 family glycosyltransferase
MKNKISFLVIVYNGIEVTKKCINSLLKFERHCEIFLLDNGSEEPIFFEFSKYSDPRLNIYKSKTNLGVVGGRNFLLKKATGDFLVFVDNDIELLNSVGQKIIENLNDLSIGIYGQRGIIFSSDFRPFVVLDKEVDAIAGFFQCFRKDLIKEIGFLDEKFLIYGQEDFDFCLRVKEKNFKVIADNSLPIIHHEHVSSSSIKNIENLKKRNFEYFVEKWKNKTNILEIEKKKINHLSCLNCSDVWGRGTA